jgi:WD40 repeat protein
LLCQLQGLHKQAISALCFSRDGRWLALGSIDRGATVVELGGAGVEEAGEAGWARVAAQLRGRELGRMGPISAAAFSSDARWLALGSTDGSAAIMERAGATSSSSCAAEEGADEWVLLTTVNMPSSSSKSSQPPPVSCVAFSPDGRWLALGSGRGRLLVVEAAAAAAAAAGTTTGVEWAVVHSARTGAGVCTLAFSHSGRWLAVGMEDRCAHVLDVPPPSSSSGSGVGSTATAPGTQQRRHGGGWWSAAARAHGLHSRAVVGCAWSHDDRWLALGSRDRTASVLAAPWQHGDGAGRAAAASTGGEGGVVQAGEWGVAARCGGRCVLFGGRFD